MTEHHHSDLTVPGDVANLRGSLINQVEAALRKGLPKTGPVTILVHADLSPLGSLNKDEDITAEGRIVVGSIVISQGRGYGR